jgi:hypothetical protein
MFQKYLKGYPSKMENVWLTAPEWQQILAIPERRNRLKELNLQCFDAELPEALALCTHITVLTIKFKGEFLPDCFGGWATLRSLSVQSEQLKSLPDSLLQLPKFRSLRISNEGKPLTLAAGWKKLIAYNGIKNPIEWI